MPQSPNFNNLIRITYFKKIIKYFQNKFTKIRFIISFMPRSLYHSFGVKKILHSINYDIKTQGMSSTIRNIIRKCANGFIIEMSKKTQKTLKKDRVILICNHPSQADVLLLLAAIPPRTNIFLIVINGILSILPAINKHLIPVYIAHRLNHKPKYDWKYHLFKKFHYTPEYPRDIAHQKNIQSITKATQKIDQGSIVGIFPAGGSENEYDFSPGVGHIIKNLKYPEKTSLVMAYVSGTSVWDFFRIIPFLRKFFPKFKIQFSEPIKTSNLPGSDGRQISKNLQTLYYRWATPLRPLPIFQTAVLYLRSILFFLFFKNQ